MSKEIYLKNILPLRSRLLGIAGLLIEWIDTVKDADPLVRTAVTTTETAVA